MLKFLKYLVIPIVAVGYLFFVDSLTQENSAVGNPFEKASSTGAEIIGVGTSVTVSVTRPYFFGLIRLPVYSGAFGDISGLHNFFFSFIIFLIAAFAIFDIIQWRRRGKWKKSWRRY